MDAHSEKRIQSLSSEDAWCWLFGVRNFLDLDPGVRPPRNLEIDEQVQALLDRRDNKNAKISLNVSEATIRRILPLSFGLQY
jgi:hypothetical protein